MKRILSIAICSLLFIMAEAQIQITPTTNVYYGSVAEQGQQLDVVWDVINNSSFTLDVRCRRQLIQEVEGSDGNFCWGSICTSWSTGNGFTQETVTLEPGQSTSTFHAKYRHNGNAGQSIFSYCFWDNNQQVEQVCYDINFCVDADCLVSVNDISASAGSLSVSPNPIENTGNITYQFRNTPSNGKLAVYNMMGAKVKEITLNNRHGVVFLGASDFAPGVYFCNLEDNGVVHQTVRMVIQ